MPDYYFRSEQPKEFLGHGPGRKLIGWAGDVVQLSPSTVKQLNRIYATRPPGQRAQLVPYKAYVKEREAELRAELEALRDGAAADLEAHETALAVNPDDPPPEDE